MAASLSGKFSGVFSKSKSLFRRNTLKNVACRAALSTSRCSLSKDPSDTGPAMSSAEPTTDSLTSLRDPFPLFAGSEVQSLLTRMTGFDLLKLAGPQIKPLEKPSYVLLTDEELAERQTEAKERLQYRLQMPPFMNPRKPFTEPLALDPDLEGHDTSKFVFTDISFGIKDRIRQVVVRHPDGSLHHGSWDVKERMNQIYNPREGRHVIKPAMFNEQNLERMLAEKSYVYILDRACCQFEPDDPDYIRTTRRVYNAVDSAKDYDILRSTRHFGPLAFYLAWNRMMDSLLLDMINRDLESHAEDLVRLHCHLHPDSPSAQAVASLTQPEPQDVIKVFVESESKLQDQLETSLQALEDTKKSKVNRPGEQRS